MGSYRTRSFARNCTRRSIHRSDRNARLGTLSALASGAHLVRRFRHNLRLAGSRFRPRKRTPLHPVEVLDCNIALHQHRVACGKHRLADWLCALLSAKLAAMGRRSAILLLHHTRTHTRHTDSSALDRHRFWHIKRLGKHYTCNMCHFKFAFSIK